MKVKINYMKVMSLVAVLGLTACGGGSKGPSAREVMSKKDGIIIFYSIPQEMCKSSNFQESMNREFPEMDLLFQVDSNDITCDTYGKNYPMCRTNNNYDYGDKSCVVGFDVDINRKTEGLSIIDEESLFEKMIIEADESTQLMF